MANLDAVIKQLQAESDRIDQAITVLNSLSGQPRRAPRTRPKRRISAAGIARIRAAAKGADGQLRRRRRAIR